MRIPGLLLAVAAAVVGACTGTAEVSPPAPARTIALSFDDATLPDGPLFDGRERTRRLIAALETAGVEEAMFFVTTGNVERNEHGDERIRSYASAGHVLGNHSHSHWWLHQTDTDEYIADLDTAIARLAVFDKVLPYYRFPFLDEGRDLDTRDRLRMALGERGLANGYVTVDTWDWFLVDLTQEAEEAGTDVDLDALRDLYVDVILKSTEYYDAMARDTLGRSPHHVLLLHENDLAALFVDDLVAAYRRRGFRIVPVTEAFSDPIAGREPDTLYLGQGRVAALAHEAGVEAAGLPSPTENEEYLRKRFRDEVLGRP